MTGFPSGLSAIEFVPFFPVEEARDEAGNVWQTMDADPYWKGSASTSKLNVARLQDWDGFMLSAMYGRLAIEFIDPIYRMPQAYKASGLPFGFDGTGQIESLSNPSAPVISGFPVGLTLKRGDRLGAISSPNKTCHIITADTVVTSNTAQAVPIVPPILDNVFDAGDDVTLVDPVIRLNVVPNSWSVPRRALSEPVGSFEVIEAGIE